MHSPHLRSGKLWISLLESRVSPQIIWKPSTWEIFFSSLFSFSPPSTLHFFISLSLCLILPLVTYLCKYRLINTLGCNLVSLFYCSNCFSFGHREPFCCLLCPIKMVYFCYIYLSFRHFLAFLALQNTPDSSCVFHVPVLESAFSAKEPHFPLLQTAVLEVSFWVLYAHCWMLLIILFICLSWQSRKMHVYSVIFIYTHIYKYFYM